MAREAIYQSSDPEPEKSGLNEKAVDGVDSTTPPVVEQDVRLRPRRMSEMVGQRDVIERLQIAIDAARRQIGRASCRERV